jgi:hypothetical protein
MTGKIIKGIAENPTEKIAGKVTGETTGGTTENIAEETGTTIVMAGGINAVGLDLILLFPLSLSERLSIPCRQGIRLLWLKAPNTTMMTGITTGHYLTAVML